MKNTDYFDNEVECNPLQELAKDINHDNVQKGFWNERFDIPRKM